MLEVERARESNPFAKAEEAEEDCTHEAVDTWKDQLIATIKDNIQINVSKVHVRLEDDFIDDFPFCVGLTLGTLAVCTCDREWQPLRKNVTRNEEGSVTSTNRRLAQVQSLAIYWDSNDWQVGLGDEISVKAFRDMIEDAAVGHCQSKQHDFVLAPASVEAKMTQRKPKEAVDSRQPELEVHAEVSHLSLRFDEAQYHALINLAYRYMHYELCKKYQARGDLRRPAAPPLSAAKADELRCAIEAATLRARGCNPKCARLQPYVREAALLPCARLQPCVREAATPPVPGAPSSLPRRRGSTPSGRRRGVLGSPRASSMRTPARRRRRRRRRRSGRRRRRTSSHQRSASSPLRKHARRGTWRPATSSPPPQPSQAGTTTCLAPCTARRRARHTGSSVACYGS